MEQSRKGASNAVGIYDPHKAKGWCACITDDEGKLVAVCILRLRACNIANDQQPVVNLSTQQYLTSKGEPGKLARFAALVASLDLITCHLFLLAARTSCTSSALVTRTSGGSKCGRGGRITRARACRTRLGLAIRKRVFDDGDFTHLLEVTLLNVPNLGTQSVDKFL